jgi:hypothetical protein
MDRRRYRRQEIHGKARILWPDESGNEIVALGSVRNVSARGALLQTGRFPPLGTQVLLELHLEDRRKRPVKLEAKGIVSRVERHSIAVATGVMKVRKSGRLRKITE